MERLSFGPMLQEIHTTRLDPRCVPTCLFEIGDGSMWKLPFGVLAATLLVSGRPLPAAEDTTVAELITTLEDPDKAESTKLRALIQLSRLGPKAAAAVPALGKFFRTGTKDLRNRKATLSVLKNIGKPAVPTLAEAVPDVEVGHWALQQLSELGTEAKEAAPAVLKAAALPIKETAERESPHSSDYQKQAFSTLVKIGASADEAVPVLVKHLQNPMVITMRGRTPLKPPFEVNGFWGANAAEALYGLENYGPEAKEAVPVLSGILKSHGNRIQYPGVVLGACVRALGGIGPDAEAGLPELRAFRDTAAGKSLAEDIETSIDKIKAK